MERPIHNFTAMPQFSMRLSTALRIVGKRSSLATSSATRAITRPVSTPDWRTKLSELGYGIQKHGNSFTLAGIDRATVDKFSRRTAIIEAEAERLGIDDAQEQGELGRRTREKKSKTPARMSELRAEWDSRLTPQERLVIQTAGSRWAKGDDPITPGQAKEYALEHSFRSEE